MAQVGLSVSGNLSNDYRVFNEKIAFLKNSSSQDYKESIRLTNLQQAAPYVFVPQVQEQSSTQTVSGADIKAMINKAFLFSL